jgi:hypothetical protein
MTIAFVSSILTSTPQSSIAVTKFGAVVAGMVVVSGCIEIEVAPLKNPIYYICSYPCIFWEFGLHFSNLHIIVYHVFNANFE